VFNGDRGFSGSWAWGWGLILCGACCVWSTDGAATPSLKLARFNHQSNANNAVASRLIKTVMFRLESRRFHLGAFQNAKGEKANERMAWSKSKKTKIEVNSLKKQTQNGGACACVTVLAALRRFSVTLYDPVRLSFGSTQGSCKPRPSFASSPARLCVVPSVPRPSCRPARLLIHRPASHTPHPILTSGACSFTHASMVRNSGCSASTGSELA
jgi:hypothetical protein